jgi:hypothetical protein
MDRILITLALGVVFLSACEEPPPVYEPEIVSHEVTCRAIDQGFGPVQKLDRISVRVRDEDGAGDLLPPTVVVEATKLEMEAVDAVTDPAEAKCGAAEQKCDVIFRWENTTEGEQIFCGAEGNALEVIFRIEDRGGHGATYIIPVRSN